MKPGSGSSQLVQLTLILRWSDLIEARERQFTARSVRSLFGDIFDYLKKINTDFGEEKKKNEKKKRKKKTRKKTFFQGFSLDSFGPV